MFGLIFFPLKHTLFYPPLCKAKGGICFSSQKLANPPYFGNFEDRTILFFCKMDVLLV